MIRMEEQNNFGKAIKGRKIPICVLDQKWHRLFAVNGKPEAIVALEEQINPLIQRQGQLYNDNKDLKKLKNKLMGNIVENMQGTHAENTDSAIEKKLDEDRRLIDEINEKIENNEDQLLELPKQIQTVNEELMQETMNYCYEKLRLNMSEAKEIAQWIVQVRIDLKKNIIKKQKKIWYLYSDN